MDWKNTRGLVPSQGATPDYQNCLAAFPALELAKQTPQGSFHREGDVWTHTKMVVDALLSEAQGARPTGRNVGRTRSGNSCEDGRWCVDARYS